MDRIIQSYLDDFLKSMEIAEKDESKQFELFASYCAVEQLYAENYNLEDIIVGEGGDCGIDAIAIIANGNIITSNDEIDDFLKINKGLFDISFIFVQAKLSPHFDYKDIGTFGTGVCDFFSENHQMVRNDNIQSKNDIVNYIFSNARNIKKLPDCYLYYITLGKWDDDENCVGRMNYAKQNLMDLDLFTNVYYNPVGKSLLQQFYRNTIVEIEKEVEFSHKISLPKIEKVTQSYLGYIDYSEYLKLITSENGEILKNVFYDNVRDYQGDNPVNNEMSDTVQTDSDKFVLFNNGVTVICEKLSSVGDKFTLSGYQIVNGCQTSHVLFYNKEKIDGSLQIPIKLIETGDEETVNHIIKATNRQTQVSNEQLIALNEFHRNLEAFYNTFSGQDLLYYERRSKQYNYKPNIEKVRIVSISTQIKAVASMFYDKPHLASRYYGRLLKSIEGIFNIDHKYWPYYTSAFVLYRLEYLFRNKSLDKKYKKFKYFILMLIKYEIANDKIPKMNANKMEDFCKKILEVARDNDVLIEEITKVIKLIDKNVDDIDSTEATKNATLVERLKSEFLPNQASCIRQI